MSNEQLNFTDLLVNEARAARTSPRREASIDDSQMTLNGPEGLISGGAGLWARPVHPHSLEKARLVHNYAQAAITAVGKRFDIWWLELFAGPGVLWSRADGAVVDGSPLEALACKGRVDGFYFSDSSSHCVASLNRAVKPFRGEKNIHVEQGNANEQSHLDKVVATIPSDALVIAYLDPEGLDLHWETIKKLAWRYKKLDLLINLPVPAIDRCLAAGTAPNIKHVEEVLGHPHPESLISGAGTRAAIRAWFNAQLAGLGYPQPVGHEVKSVSKRVPQYDLLLASRNPLGPELYKRSNTNAAGGQRGLTLAG